MFQLWAEHKRFCLLKLTNRTPLIRKFSNYHKYRVKDHWESNCQSMASAIVRNGTQLCSIINHRMELLMMLFTYLRKSGSEHHPSQTVSSFNIRNRLARPWSSKRSFAARIWIIRTLLHRSFSKKKRLRHYTSSMAPQLVRTQRLICSREAEEGRLAANMSSCRDEIWKVRPWSRGNSM